MVEILTAVGGLYVQYVKGMLVVLPLILVVALLHPRWIAATSACAVHRVIVLATLLLPLVMMLPLPRPEFSITSPVMPAAVGAAGVVVEAAARPPVLSTAAILGLAGVIGSVVWLFRLGLQFSVERKIAGSSRKSWKIGRVRVVFSERVHSAFSSGFLRPTVFLPSRLQESAELQLCIAHEGAHLRYNHLTMVFIEKLSLVLFWFNPLQYWLHTKGTELREVICDEVVAARFGSERYSRVLLDEAASRSAHRGFVMANSLNVGASLLKKRITLLLEARMSPKRTVFVGGLLIAVLVSTFTFVSFAGQVAPWRVDWNDTTLTEEMVPLQKKMDQRDETGLELSEFFDAIAPLWERLNAVYTQYRDEGDKGPILLVSVDTQGKVDDIKVFKGGMSGEQKFVRKAIKASRAFDMPKTTTGDEYAFTIPVHVPRKARSAEEAAEGKEEFQRAGLTKRDVMEVLMAKLGDLRGVYNSHLPNKELQGKILVTFQVQPDGRVREVSVIDSMETRNEEFIADVHNELSTWELPASPKNVEYSLVYPFTFHQ